MEKFLTSLILMIGMIVLIILFSAFMAFPTMWLWNGTLIAVFPTIKAITFWQAWGLNILGGILFRGSNTATNTSSKK